MLPACAERTYVPGRYASERAFVLDTCSSTLQYAEIGTETETGIEMRIRMRIGRNIQVGIHRKHLE